MKPSHPTFPLEVLVSLHGAERVAKLLAAGPGDPGGQPRAAAVTSAPAGAARPEDLDAVRSCPDRFNTGRPCRCTWRCGADGPVVSLDECLSCVRGES